MIITNPPWEVFQTDEKEFFQQFDPLIQKKKLRITDWKKQRKQLLQDPEIAQAWLDYASGFPHVSRYVKLSPQYRNQISRMDGKIVSRKINLYALFTEQCFHLLRDGGACGIVLPSGIYSDLGTKQLRKMLFSSTEIAGLFGFENKKLIFEEVSSLEKFIVLSYVKGGSTKSFPVAFMYHDVADLTNFPNEDSIWIDVSLIENLSPDSLSVFECRSPLDIQIAEKMLTIPLLNQETANSWKAKLGQELNMTNDSDLFQTYPTPGCFPVYEGKMIWQFEHVYANPRYWVDANDGRERLLRKRRPVTEKTLSYPRYRLGFRDVARATDNRSVIATIIPQHSFAGNTLNLFIEPNTMHQQLIICAFLNSFIVDWRVRQINRHVNMFYMYQTPIPRMQAGDRYFAEIVERAARLICTAPEYDALAAEVGLGDHRAGATDPAERARLRAELDGMVARVYGLSEAEFAHVLGTFPLVAAEVKDAALAAFRDLG